MKNQTEKPKRLRGRPVEYPMPDPIPDTSENVMLCLAMDHSAKTGRAVSLPVSPEDFE